MPQCIPVIDVRDYLAGRAGALESSAEQVREALTTVGFFVLTGHDLPHGLIDRTFAQAARFHDLPMNKKLGLKLNEHVNGYMAMSRYARMDFRRKRQRQAGPERGVFYQARAGSR